MWTDKQTPKELKEIVETQKTSTSLELGFGVGHFFMASQGIQATGVNFSAVAIEKAMKQVANNTKKTHF